MVKINWTSVLQKCQPQARQRIIDLRARHEDLNRQLSELRGQLPNIDWMQYREALRESKTEQVDLLEAKAAQFKPRVQDIQPALLLVEKEKQEKVRVVVF